MSRRQIFFSGVSRGTVVKGLDNFRPAIVKCAGQPKNMTEKTIKALFVDNNRGDATQFRVMFDGQQSQDIEWMHAPSMSEFEKYIAEREVDIVLLDLEASDAQGLETIRRARAAAPRVPLVVLTGMDDESFAMQALHEGAQDFLIKGQIDTRGLLRALRYANERKRLESLKDEFVSSVSHELRTPLTSISGSLGLLMGHAAGSLPEPAIRLLKIAHANSQRLVRLVNDILDIEKMESGRVVFNFGRINIRSLVEEAIEANRGFAEANGVRIRFDDAETIADVRADSDRLAQVVTNLLSNAIKFSPADNEVVVALKKESGAVHISVRDHGSGISAEFKPRIFERFAQADATNARQQGGTGLGLSIVKQIVDRLGGHVGFADAPGGGTIFDVELPCWERFEAVTTDRGALPDALRILLCEDDLDSSVVLREQLRPAGYATDFAFTADEAIQRAEATQYSAILVDLMLPDRNGISVMLRLRQLPQYSETPIIVVSVDPNSGRDDARSSTLNVMDWLKKPVDFERLIRGLPKPVLHRAN